MINHSSTGPKRKRRTKVDITAIEDAMYHILEEVHPRTGRNVFYVVSGLHLIAKTENEYNNTVIRLLTRMRKQRRLPFSWLADATRWVRKPRTYTGLNGALENFANAYRRDVWADMDVHVEIWTEKDAIASIMYEETSAWDVPLLAGRGYASHSFLYSSAEYMREIGKPAYVYYFGDYDPRGVDISRFVEQSLREYAEGIEIKFERVALTREQIDRWSLPTRPTKREKSGFGKNFDPDSVDIDTMDPRDLRALVKACITSHITQTQLDNLHLVEEEERNLLLEIRQQMTTETAAKLPGARGAKPPGEKYALTEALRLTLNAFLAGHTPMLWDDIVGAVETLRIAAQASKEAAESEEDEDE